MPRAITRAATPKTTRPTTTVKGGKGRGHKGGYDRGKNGDRKAGKGRDHKGGHDRGNNDNNNNVNNNDNHKDSKGRNGKSGHDRGGKGKDRDGMDPAAM